MNRKTYISPQSTELAAPQKELHYVTLMVKDLNYSLGQVIDDRIWLNEAGNIISEQWLKLERNYPYLILHDFVVMPNHIHGIVEVARHWMPRNSLAKTMAEILKHFQKLASSEIFEAGFDDFAWQGAIEDRIIYDAPTLARLQAHISNNVRLWPEDTLYMVPVIEELEQQREAVYQKVR
jgi:putative transposase